jgi:hypothetical protein
LYADKHFSALGSWAVRVLTFAVEGPIRRLHAGAMGGDGAAETAEAYRRLRAFAGAPDWRRSTALQRQA